MLSQTRKKVLIVDDSRVVLAVHGAILSGAGYDCTTAESGAEALETVVKGGVDLIVTDMNMPRMDGLELTRRVRAMPDGRGIPVIMISTEAGAGDEAAGLDAGVDIYVHKPIDGEVLVRHCRLLLGA